MSGIVALMPALATQFALPSPVAMPDPTITEPPHAALVRRQLSLPQCTQYVSYYSSCESAIPNLSLQSDSVLAGCICYIDSTFQPSVIDGAINTCISAASVSDPADYSRYSFSILSDFCSLQGDVLSLGTGGSITSSASVDSARLSSLSRGCDTAFTSLTSSCARATPSFVDLLPSAQAPCLCYDADGTYDPEKFDEPFSRCVDYFITASSAALSSITSSAGITDLNEFRSQCSSIGDVVASNSGSTPTPSASATRPSSNGGELGNVGAGLSGGGSSGDSGGDSGGNNGGSGGGNNGGGNGGSGAPSQSGGGNGNPNGADGKQGEAAKSLSVLAALNVALVSFFWL